MTHDDNSPEFPRYARPADDDLIGKDVEEDDEDDFDEDDLEDEDDEEEEEA